MLAKFSGLNPKGPYLSLKKETFFVVFTCSLKRAREIRKFHVAVVQRRLKIWAKKRDARAKVLVLLIQTYCFFAVLVALAVIVA